MIDLLTVAKDFILPVVLTVGGFWAGRGRKQAETEQIQQNTKTTEFDRINAVCNELQQENRARWDETRELRLEIKTLRTENISERANDQTRIRHLESERFGDQGRIRQLESEVKELRAENAELRADLQASNKNSISGNERTKGL